MRGQLFAAASLITPFFMGTVVGAVATGQVPVHPAGNVLAAWRQPWYSPSWLSRRSGMCSSQRRR